MHRLTLNVLSTRLAVCFLPPDEPLPNWAMRGVFCSVTRTGEELSIVCDSTVVPRGIMQEGPWSGLQVEGPLDFSLTGVLSSLAEPLAGAGISIFAVSTYRTDYLLVPEASLSTALDVLRTAGHTVRIAPTA